MIYNVIEKDSQPTLAIHTRAAAHDMPSIMGRMFQQIMQYLEEIGEKPCEAAYACYHNSDPNDFDVDIGFLVEKPLPGRGDIKPCEIPSGKQVTCLHQGPYSELEQVYTDLMSWISQQGYTISGGVYELYLNDASQTPEQKPLTKVIVPVNIQG